METTETYLQMQLDREWDADAYGNMTKVVKCASTWIEKIGFSIENCQNITALLLKMVNKCYWPSVKDPDGDGCMLSADENDLGEVRLKTCLYIIIEPDYNNNEDIVSSICTLFVSAVGRHSTLLLTGITTSDPELSSLCSRLVDEILQYTDKPGIYPVEESCSSTALGFWYLLQTKVFDIASEAEHLKCWEYITQLYAHLTRILSLDDKAIAYDRLILYALKAMTLPENGPIRTSIQFLSHFVMQSRNYPQMTGHANQNQK
uniref:Uncharacterized protein n=1 Tax=Glossina pallidipes TaxID=7398 RepID=A0A1A9ZQ87_GLOPL